VRVRVCVGAFVAAAALLAVPVTAAAGSATPRQIARAINLRASDLPGFTQEGPEHSSGDVLTGKAKQDCPSLVGSGRSHGLADVSSPSFQRESSADDQQLTSEVKIERSRGIVTSGMAELRKPGVLACFRRVFTGLKYHQSGDTITVKHVSVTSPPVTAPGADGAVDIRIKLEMVIKTYSVPMQMDLVGIAVGRDELSLLTMGLVEPISDSAEQQLESLLVKRALANPH
jgi:hypothetical protein